MSNSLHECRFFLGIDFFIAEGLSRLKIKTNLPRIEKMEKKGFYIKKGY